MVERKSWTGQAFLDIQQKDETQRCFVLQMLGVFLWGVFFGKKGWFSLCIRSHEEKKMYVDGRCEPVALLIWITHSPELKFQMFTLATTFDSSQEAPRKHTHGEICVFIEDGVARGCFRKSWKFTHPEKWSVFGELNGILIYSSWWVGDERVPAERERERTGC